MPPKRTIADFFQRTQDVITSFQDNPLTEKLLNDIKESARAEAAGPKADLLEEALTASFLPDETKYEYIDLITEAYQGLLGDKDYFRLPGGKGIVKQSDIDKWIEEDIEKRAKEGWYSGLGDRGLLSLGMTNMEFTPEGVPIVNMRDVQSFSKEPALGFKSSYFDQEAGTTKPYIAMSGDLSEFGQPEAIASPISMTPEQQFERSMTLHHEIGHTGPTRTGGIYEGYEDNGDDVPWEKRPHEKRADLYALDVLKQNLDRAGMPYTPEIGIAALMSDSPREVIPNPSQVPFLNRLDYLPTSGYDVKERPTFNIDALGRIMQGTTMDIEESLRSRRDLGFLMTGINPSLMFGGLSGALPEESFLTYLDKYGDRKLYDYERLISRLGLAKKFID